MRFAPSSWVILVWSYFIRFGHSFLLNKSQATSLVFLVSPRRWLSLLLINLPSVWVFTRTWRLFNQSRWLSSPSEHASDDFLLTNPDWSYSNCLSAVLARWFFPARSLFHCCWHSICKTCCIFDLASDCPCDCDNQVNICQSLGKRTSLSWSFSWQS